MKINIKSFIAGAVVASLLSTTAFAATTGYKKVEAIMSGVKIYINGALIDARDVNGNHVEPLNYNGTVYLPVRAVSQSLDKNVEWDGKNNSVYIKDKIVTSGTTDPANQTPDATNQVPEATQEVPMVNSLLELEYSEIHFSQGSNVSKIQAGESFKDNYGNTYENGFIYKLQYSKDSSQNKAITAPYVETEFVLDKKYKAIEGKLYVKSSGKSDDKFTYKLYCDGQLFSRSPELSASSMPLSFWTNVEGVSKLKIIVSQVGTDQGDTTYDSYFVVGDATLK